MIASSCRHRRLSPLRQMIRFGCSSCIIICVALATVASSAPTAEGEPLTRDDALEKSLDDLEEKYQAEDKDVAPSDVEQKPHVSTHHVSSGLAMLPKMKPMNDNSDENSEDGDVREPTEDHYSASVEYVEPQMDDFDVELLERFLNLLDGTSGSDDVIYDGLMPVDSSHPQNSSSEDDSSEEKKPEMTSSAHERDKRSADNHVAMTAENMISADETAAVNRPLRLKRDLGDYLYNHHWTGADDYEMPVMDDSLPDGRSEDDFTDPATFAGDYDEQHPWSEAQLRRYMDLLRAVEDMQDVGGPAYGPVVYRGVNGIFVPETSVRKKHGGRYDWRQSSSALPFTTDEVESAADKWSVLVREEVKKALDEYDLVYRLAEALKKHGV